MSRQATRSQRTTHLDQPVGDLEPTRRRAPIFHRILTVTDHEMARDWLAGAIGRETDLSVCAEAGDAAAALALLAAEAPALVILETPFQGVHTLELLKELRKQAAAVPILIIGETLSGARVEAAIRAGARGYVHRREPKTSVIAAIRRILAGGVYVSEVNTEAMLRRMCSIESAVINCDRHELSTRELEVLTLLGSGYKPGAIASQLRVSIRTIESYTGRIRQKLAIQTANDLILVAVAWMRGRPV